MSCYNCRNDTSVAAGNGHKKCLEYCVAQECPWDPTTTRIAASGGHKECLEYCVAQGCPWHPETTRTAARNGHKECLEYIFKNCKDFETWETSGLDDIVQYSSEIRNYIESIEEEWKWHSERQKNIKG